MPAVPILPARFGRRLLASLIDWVICVLISFFAVRSALWLVIVPLCVVVYFAVFLFYGRTPGMRATSIRVEDRRTGRAPGAGKAVARSLLALLQAGSGLALFIFAFSDSPSGGYTTVDIAVLAGSAAITLTALFAHLWMYVDSERRTLLDRLFGLAIAGN